MKKILILLVLMVLVVSAVSAEEFPDKNFDLILSMSKHAGKFFTYGDSLYLLEKEQRGVVTLDGKMFLVQNLDVLDYAIQKMRDKIQSLGPTLNTMRVDEVYYTYWGGGYALVRAIIP